MLLRSLQRGPSERARLGRAHFCRSHTELVPVFRLSARTITMGLKLNKNEHKKKPSDEEGFTSDGSPDRRSCNVGVAGDLIDRRKG